MLTLTSLAAVPLAACSHGKTVSNIAAPSDCGHPDPGVTASAIDVGAIYPTTGPQGQFFGAVGSGIRARFKVANDQGGVGGRALHLDTADDGDGQQENGAAATQLVQADHDFGVIEASTNSDGSGPYLNHLGIPVTGWGITPSWGRYRNMFGYRYSTSPKPEGEPVTRAASFIKSHGGHRVAVLAGGATASVTFANQFQQTLAPSGLELGYKNLDEALGQTDFSADVKAMQKAGVDSLFTGLDTNANIAIFQAAADTGLHFTVSILPAGYDARLAAAYGKVLEGAYFEVDWRPFELPIPAHAKFKDALHAVAPNEFPGQLAMVGWLSADVFIRGLEAAGTKCPTRTAFIHNLRLVKDYTADGLLPPTDFAALFGKMPLCYWIVQIHNDAFVPAGPDPFCGSLLKGHA